MSVAALSRLRFDLVECSAQWSVVSQNCADCTGCIYGRLYDVDPGCFRILFELMEHVVLVLILVEKVRLAPVHVRQAACDTAPYVINGLDFK